MLYLSQSKLDLLFYILQIYFRRDKIMADLNIKTLRNMQLSENYLLNLSDNMYEYFVLYVDVLETCFFKIFFLSR